MKIYEAWEELKERIAELSSEAYAHNMPNTGQRYKLILNLMDELEMKHE
jgi:hypothetical protein